MLVEVFKREYKPFDDHIYDVYYFPSSCLRAYLAHSVLHK